MNLIIDTSSEKLKVILKGNNVFLENEETNMKHLQHLLPQIDKILQKANASVKDLKLLSVVLGPGSFTGVRIGVSTVKAFMCAHPHIKAIGVNMLELLSYVIIKNLKVSTNFAIIIKSTSTKYYFAVSSSTGVLQKQTLLTSSELEEFLKENKMPLFSYNIEYKTEQNRATVITLSTSDYVEFVDQLVSKKAFSQDLKPIYLALSQAEEELLKRENKTV